MAGGRHETGHNNFWCDNVWLCAELEENKHIGKMNKAREMRLGKTMSVF